MIYFYTQKRKNYINSFLSFTVFTLFLSSCKEAPKSEIQGPPRGAPVGIEAVTAQTKAMNQEIEVSGTVMANEMVELKPEVQGRVTNIYFQEGASVNQGSLLLKLNDQDLQASLMKAQAQLEIAKSTEGRLKRVLEANGVNQQEYDVAALQVKTLQADLEFLKAQIRKTEIRAPFSGNIGLRNVSLGAFIGPSDIVATLQQESKVKLDFLVPDVYAGNIKKGGKVNLVLAGNSDTISANIIALESQLNQSTRNLRVRAVINSKDLVRPGTFARVFIPQGAQEPHIVIPTNAIVPDTRYKKVYKINNGKASLVNVTTGLRSKNDIEVLSGLNVGDTIAVSGILFLRPDADVTVKKLLN